MIENPHGLLNAMLGYGAVVENENNIFLTFPDSIFLSKHYRIDILNSLNQMKPQTNESEFVGENI